MKRTSLAILLLAFVIHAYAYPSIGDPKSSFGAVARNEYPGTQSDNVENAKRESYSHRPFVSYPGADGDSDDKSTT
ncbi:hypothetical protein C8F01DRAFT_1149174, partial [Mycena amicta]